jgi:hypothetical protein
MLLTITLILYFVITQVTERNELQGNGPKQHTDLSTERNGMQETPISKRRPKGISTTNTLGLYYLTKGKLVV